MNLTFVVSSGRAGSTLLSRMLHEHPEVLSVSEFFAALRGVLRRAPYPGHDMDGTQLWRMLSAPEPIADAVVRHGLHTAEMCYPYGRGRFRPGTGMPVICHTTLPMLTGDPDALYDRLAAEVPRWPVRPAAEQYRAFFGYLGGLLGRPVVVERSGGSLFDVRLLRSQFPLARLVHLYRDGPDCALSMSRFPFFQVGALAYQAAAEAGLPPWASWAEIQQALPARFTGLLSPPFDLSRLAGFEFSPEFFGHQWSLMVADGVAALGSLPPGEWHALSYAGLLKDPAAELTRLAGFIGVEATPQWLAAAGRLADPGRAGAAARLAPQTLAALRAACERGEAALAKQARLRTAA